MNWFIKLIFVAISEVLIAGVDYLADIINDIFNFMYELNVSLNFETISNYTVMMAITLTSLYAIKQGIDVYVLHVDGDPDADSLELLTRVSITVATIMCGQWFITYLIGLASTLSTEVVATVVYPERTIGEIFVDVITKIMSMGTMLAFIQLIFIGVTLVAFIIFITKAAKRGAELILFQVMLPLLALDLLTTNKERWNAFKTELMICIFGYIIQLFCFNVFMILFAQVMSVSGMLDPKIMFGALAWLMIVLSAPKWIQKFIYSSGVGQATKGGARSVMYLIPKIR